MTLLHFIIGLVTFFSLFSMIMAASNKTTRLIAATLVPVLLGSVYLGYSATEQLKGIPTSLLPKEKWIYISSYVESNDYIYLFARPLDEKTPKLYAVPYSAKRASIFEQAHQNMCEGKTILGDGFDGPIRFTTDIANNQGSDGPESDSLNMYEFNTKELTKK